MCKLKIMGVVLLSTIVIGAVLFLRYGGSMHPPSSQTGGERITAESVPLPAITQSPPATQRSPLALAKEGHSDFKAAFSSATNYWSYAHAILADARAGNPDAEFYLWKAMEFCDYANRAYFHPQNIRLTLDEALQLAASQMRPAEETQAIYDHCHDFLERDASDLGRAADWLQKATEAGQPVAEATTAQKMYAQDYLKSFLNAGAAVTPENSAAPIGNGADPRQLLLAAAQSLDPEALFEISRAQGSYEQLHPPGDGPNINQLAWMFVACQRGYDCSGKADWITTGCPNCGTRFPPGQGPENALMTVAGDSWPAVQQRAQEISGKLDAGQWDELDLGS